MAKQTVIKKIQVFDRYRRLVEIWPDGSVNVEIHRLKFDRWEPVISKLFQNWWIVSSAKGIEKRLIKANNWTDDVIKMAEVYECF